MVHRVTLSILTVETEEVVVEEVQRTQGLQLLVQVVKEVTAGEGKWEDLLGEEAVEVVPQLLELRVLVLLTGVLEHKTLLMVVLPIGREEVEGHLMLAAGILEVELVELEEVELVLILLPSRKRPLVVQTQEEGVVVRIMEEPVPQVVRVL
jgi:hypothetical protein